MDHCPAHYGWPAFFLMFPDNMADWLSTVIRADYEGLTAGRQTTQQWNVGSLVPEIWSVFRLGNSYWRGEGYSLVGPVKKDEWHFSHYSMDRNDKHITLGVGLLAYPSISPPLWIITYWCYQRKRWEEEAFKRLLDSLGPTFGSQRLSDREGVANWEPWSGGIQSVCFIMLQFSLNVLLMEIQRRRQVSAM